jgi:hypothetical protein
MCHYLIPHGYLIMGVYALRKQEQVFTIIQKNSILRLMFFDKLKFILETIKLT